MITTINKFRPIYENNQMIINKIIKMIDLYENENEEWRWKEYDVYEEDGSIYVKYITQKEESGGEGEAVMIDKLKEIAESYNVQIYLYYEIRDYATYSPSREQFTIINL